MNETVQRKTKVMSSSSEDSCCASGLFSHSTICFKDEFQSTPAM